jgi:bacterioferritin
MPTLGVPVPTRRGREARGALRRPGRRDGMEFASRPAGFLEDRTGRCLVVARNGRAELIDSLNDDLAREYQAIIAYVVYSQTLKGAAYMSIAKELEAHAAQELSHAITIAKSIDYLGGTPVAIAKPVKVTDKPTEMLRADLDNENETIRQYRERVKQCEALGEFAIAEDLREILREEQEHQIDLATALGEPVPDVSKITGPKK